MNNINVGEVYKHFKGTVYKIIAIAKHSETMEDLVIYQQINDTTKIWARPINMFNDTITKDNVTFKRFTKIS